MNSYTKYFIGLLFSFLLIVICIFRTDFFVHNTFTIYLFVFLKTIGIILFLWFLTSFFTKKWKLKLFLICIFELTTFIFTRYSPIFNKRIELITRFPKLRNFIHPVTRNLSHFAIWNQSNIQSSLQFDEQCGVFDENLFYRLKKGKFDFNLIEFENQFSVNSFGVRDDEESLKYPKLIFLGDSFTMGWGVNQDETYESIVEKKLNLKSLNSGIASYGTAREYLLWKQMQKDSCEALIIQYCDNDFEENKVFVSKKGLEKRSEENYLMKQNLNKLLSTNFPFRNSFQVLNYLLTYKLDEFKQNNSPQSKVNLKEKGETDVEVFVSIIEQFQAEFAKPIIIFNLNPYGTDESFYLKMNAILKKKQLNNIYLINTSTFINNEYYNLDLHLKKNGHQMMANSIIELIKELRNK
jgi:hypothetical protein